MTKRPLTFEFEEPREHFNSLMRWADEAERELDRYRSVIKNLHDEFEIKARALRALKTKPAYYSFTEQGLQAYADLCSRTISASAKGREK